MIVLQHGIYMDIPCITTSMDIPRISMDILRMYHVYVGDLHIRGIYHVYAWYVPKIQPVPEPR